ncbi:MAG: hypothetical protein D6714_13915 [Bacteroidetes bacterium]|nr:MAG: hypothetical protein D6714_13915 [Bacteroidota bacterium]
MNGSVCFRRRAQALFFTPFAGAGFKPDLFLDLNFDLNLNLKPCLRLRFRWRVPGIFLTVFDLF